MPPDRGGHKPRAQAAIANGTLAVVVMLGTNEAKGGTGPVEMLARFFVCLGGNGLLSCFLESFSHNDYTFSPWVS